MGNIHLVCLPLRPSAQVICVLLVRPVDTFLPCDATHSAVMTLHVCPSVCPCERRDATD